MANILLTIDVEDWFQVENFKKWIPYSTWPSRELRVEKNTHRLLDLFDAADLKPPSLRASQPQAECRPKATFFVLGWIAERLPNLVREIQARGHEVASHGYHHNLCYQECHENLKKDLSDSKKLLEDITGQAINGYRAPNFSISNDILNLIQDCGYLYDSSYNSFAMHGRYGKLNMSTNETKGITFICPASGLGPPSLPASQHAGLCASQHPSFYELPISNLEFKINNSKFVLPWGGGGYFRLIPFFVFRLGIRHILNSDNAYILYLHPWETDPGQPKVKEASPFYKFRHYVNLDKTLLRLRKILHGFSSCRFITCNQYLNLQNTAEVL